MGEFTNKALSGEFMDLDYINPFTARAPENARITSLPERPKTPDRIWLSSCPILMAQNEKTFSFKPIILSSLTQINCFTAVE